MAMTIASRLLAGLARSIASWPSQPGKFVLMTKNKTATKISTKARQRAAAAKSVDLAKARRSASNPHAVASPIAAQAEAICPNEVLRIPRSCKIRTRTGKAVMLIETATKRAKGANEAPGWAKRL